MEVLSVVASISALVGTSRAITAAFIKVQAVCKDANKGIKDLQREHGTISNVVENLERVVEDRLKHSVDPDTVELVGTVIRDTQATLDELHKRIGKLIPPSNRHERMAAFLLRYNYLWNEKALQATMLRLQARKDALSLILNMQSSIDSNEMRKELAVIRAALEDHLSAVRSTTPDVPDAASLSKSDAESVADDAHSVAHGALSASVWSSGAAETISSSTAPTTPAETTNGDSDTTGESFSVRDLTRRFDDALFKSTTTGPKGERIQQRTAQLNAKRAAAVSAAAGAQSPPGHIGSLVQIVASAEACASGLSDAKTIQAYQALAKAYEDAGRYEDALENYHQALYGSEFFKGASHPKTLDISDCIARIFEIQSRWQDALEYYLGSLSGRQSNETLGLSHPSILYAETRVARMLSKTGEPELALVHFASILDRYQSWPNGGKAAALEVRLDMSLIQLDLSNEAADLQAAKALLAEYNTLRDSRVKSFGPNDYRTKDTQSGLDRLSEAIRVATFRQLPAVPSPEPPQEKFAEIEEYERRVEVAVNKYGRHHPETLEIMLTLADAYYRHDKYDQAISWFLEVLHRQEPILDTHHPTMMKTLHSLGVCYAEKGEPGTALQYLDRALTGRRIKLAKNHPMTLSTLVQISSVHEALGDFHMAKESLTGAIAGYQEKFGEFDANTVSARFQLARLYNGHGSLAQAEALHREVLLARLEVHGPNHTLTLSSKFELANMLCARGDNIGALPLLHEVYDGEVELFGELHHAVTATASHLASVYWDTSKPSEALGFYIVMLKGIQSNDKQNATAGTTTMANIALCYSQMGMFENAYSWSERVSTILDTELGVQHEEAVDAALSLARASVDYKKFDVAIEQYERVLRFREQAPVRDVEGLQAVLHQLGFVAGKLGQTERALHWGRRLLDLGPGGDIEDRLVTMRRMGHILAAQHKNEEALDLLQQAMNQAAGALEEDHWLNARLPEDVSGVLANICGRCDDLQELEKYRQLIRDMLERNEPMGVQLLVKLASVHKRQQQQHEALSLLEEALVAVEHMPKGPEVYSLRLEVVSDLADARLDMYDLTAAMKCLKELVDAKEDTSWRAGALSRMVLLHVRESNFDDAIDVAKLQLGESERDSGPDSLQTLRLVSQIASLTSRVGRLKDALQWAHRALSGFRHSEDPGAKSHELSTLSLLSGIHFKAGDPQQARTTQEMCVTGFEATLGFDHETTLSEALDLADIYAFLGLDDDALWWYSRVVECKKAKLQGVQSKECDKAEQEIRRLKQKRGGALAATGGGRQASLG